MDPEKIKIWIEIVGGIVAIIAVLGGGLWAYTKFVVERGYLAPVEFTIDCNSLGVQGDKRLIEILLHLKNLGSSTLVAKDIAARIRYMKSEEEIELFTDPKKPTFGRTKFPHVQTRTLTGEQQDAPSIVTIMAYDTFVQPKVDQVYTLVTALPRSASFVLIWAKFHYAKRPSVLQWLTVKLSRRLGLIHYSLDHVTEPHTIERAFRLSQCTDQSNAK